MNKGISLYDGQIELHPLRLRNRREWLFLTTVNKQWLEPWEATSPVESKPSTYTEMVNHCKRDAKAGRSYSFAIWYNNQMVGLITLGGIFYGSLRGAHIGYWIDETFANKGITTRSVNLVTRFAFEKLNLHRVEIALLESNASSRRVAEKAGYVLEDIRKNYLHVNGKWQDHLVFVKENSEGTNE